MKGISLKQVTQTERISHWHVSRLNLESTIRFTRFNFLLYFPKDCHNSILQISAFLKLPYYTEFHNWPRFFLYLYCGWNNIKQKSNSGELKAERVDHPAEISNKSFKFKLSLPLQWRRNRAQRHSCKKRSFLLEKKKMGFLEKFLGNWDDGPAEWWAPDSIALAICR